MPKNKFLIVGAIVLILALSVLGLVVGALGQSILKGLTLPSWIVPQAPEPQLPAEAIFHIGGFVITNTMLTTWITMIFLIGFFWGVTRKIKLIPPRLQSIAENVLNWILELCEDTAGRANGRRFFPLVATIFLFIIVNAWMNLLPGYGSILIGTRSETMVPLLRGANTDINLPLALALITFVMVEWWGLRAIGTFRYLGKFFNFGPLLHGIKNVGKEGIMGVFNGIIAFFVGILELIMEFVRIISLTFRLFGNMTGGEILILMILFLVPFAVPLVFYGLEGLVGFVQALVFAGLTLVFAVVAVTPHSEHDEHEHAAEH